MKEPINICQIKELKLSCFGCCGYDFESEEEIEKEVKAQTKVFDEWDKNDLLGFRDRFENIENNEWVLNKTGICHNLIKRGNNFVCPLHPALNDGYELRAGHCEHWYRCKTKVRFDSWDNKRQNLFLEFLKEKGFKSYEYSCKMNNGELLALFLEWINTRNQNKDE